MNAEPAVADWPPPLVAVMLPAAAGLTVTERLPVCVPSLTVTLAASLVESDDAVARAGHARDAVSEGDRGRRPKAIAVRELFVTVGLFARIELAPLKVRLLLPV